ncbi:hypothetical protein AAG906_015477 [Vitis piasezkii]
MPFKEMENTIYSKLAAICISHDIDDRGIWHVVTKGPQGARSSGKIFGKVTIRDQPPSNTIQKIIAVKEAMRDVENYLQNLNVTLLKYVQLFFQVSPRYVTTEVALVLLGSATTLLVIPFNYVLGFVILDLFTRELEFQRTQNNIKSR